jgi:hypothetical protein
MSALSMTVEADPLPIQIIGVLKRDLVDHFWFRLANGTSVDLSFDELATRQALVGMFGGEAWLRRNFPGAFVVVAAREGGGRQVATGIDFVAAANHLALLCIDAEVTAEMEAARADHLWDRLVRAVVAGLGWFHV